MTLLDESWKRAWRNLELPESTGLRQQLVAAHSENHRHYHTIQHLSECIALFEGVIADAVQPGEVEIALWFHDAIYELRGKDNERRSADWALQELENSGASQQILARVECLIMATCHSAVPSEPDQQLLVDIDLSILGSSPARFAEYDKQVRAEYSWVPAVLYKMKRREVLRSFLARESIYCTPSFKERFEHQARLNLNAALG